MNTPKTELLKYVCNQGHTHEVVATSTEVLVLQIKGTCPIARPNPVKK